MEETCPRSGKSAGSKAGSMTQGCGSFLGQLMDQHFSSLTGTGLGQRTRSKILAGLCSLSCKTQRSQRSACPRLEMPLTSCTTSPCLSFLFQAPFRRVEGLL